MFDPNLPPAPLAAGSLDQTPQAITRPFIFRVGTVSITIPASGYNAVGVVTLSPPLDLVTNYKAFASVNDIAAAWSARARIASVSSLQVLAVRSSPSTSSAVSPGSTDNASTPEYPSDTQIDPGTGHTHQLNAAGFATHTHTVTGTHTHSLLPGAVAVTLNADWMLVHI